MLYYLFPGQGSQTIGMGKSLYENSDSVKARFKEASDLINVDMAKLCFGGPEDFLKQTQNTQPALFLISYCVYEFFKNEGIKADICAGHSLGEYSAIAAAGVIDFENGIKLVRKRGELMSLAKSGSMAAIIGLAKDKINEICNECSVGSEIVVSANYNSPSQVVISGTTKAVEDTLDKMKSAGAKRALLLPVSGAFHSPLMQDAADEMKNVLADVKFNNPEIPVICNVTANAETEGEKIKSLLVDQLVSPVRWVDSFENAEAGTAIEMGSGKVLMGLLRAINRNISVTPVSDIDSITKKIAELK